MKLRNKKTGEIRELPDGFFCGDNLKKICEEWEDVPEEPKEYWYIAYNGIVECFEYDDDWQYMDFNWQDKLKQIGNYFETKEEAEKAVEKLKAWKRLKDARLKFTDFGYNLDELSSSTIGADGKICFEMMCYEDFTDDLNLLFGGEE